MGDRNLKGKLQTQAKKAERRRLERAIEENGHHALEQDEGLMADREVAAILEDIEACAALESELDRVGASMRTAGYAYGVMVMDLGETVALLGPPRLRPRPEWRGSKADLLVLLATVPDDVGTKLLWERVLLQV
jgi:hypothetical protein